MKTPDFEWFEVNH